jgi:WD40 repeat protein
VTHWQLDDGVYLTHMVLEGDKIFACGSGRVIYEWDIATGMFTRSLTGHTRPLTCLSVTESKIVSAAEDHTVCIWYYKKTKNMYKAGTAELLMEQSDPTFPDIPIRVITA